MPTYYFHIRRHEEVLHDLEGTELGSVEEAHQEAVLAAREILAQRLVKGEPVDGDVFEVVDEEGNIVDTLPLRSVLILKP